MIQPPSHEQTPAGYRCGAAVVEVQGDDPDSARWLAEFLTPWFEPVALGQGELSVQLTCSAAAFAALECRAAAATLHPVACFALDSQVVSLPSWAGDDGGTVVADREHGCFYRVRRRAVEIIAQPGVCRLRVGLMRVVRELAVARILANESVLDLHAAAFAVGDRAVLLAGPKGAGKTTLLVNVLASGRASLLANDRVLVDAGAHPERAFGMPTLVSVKEGTLQLFPNLRLDAHERPALLHAGEMRSRDAGASGGDDAPRVFALSPGQLARRLGAGTAQSAPLAAIVFPEISPTVDTWLLEPLAQAEAAGRLRACRYGARLGRRPRTVFEESADGRLCRPEEQAAVVHRLAARLPFLRCRLGRDAYRDGADAWLRALPLGPASGTRVA